MSIRTIGELKTAVEQAGSVEDADALEHCAQEYEAIATLESLAMAAQTRGSVERIRGNMRTSIEHDLRALEMFSAIGDKQKIAAVCANLSITEIKTGNFADAMEYSQRALALYKELRDIAGEANVYHLLGSVHYNTGELAIALQHYQRSMALREERGDARGAAITLSNIGGVYDGIGNYPQALEKFHQALAIMQELGDRKEVARITGNIGVVYENTGNYEMSLECKQRSLSLYEELNDRHGIAYSVGSLGTLFASMLRYTEALECYRRSLAIYEELSNREAVARATGNLILAMLNLGEFHEAERLLAEYERVHIVHPSTVINRLYARAVIQIHAGELDQAMETYRVALQHARDSSNVPSQAAAHANLRDLCQKRNDFAGYIEHNNEYNRITEEINGKDTAAKLALLEAEQKMAKERAEHEKHLSILHSTLPKTIADRVARGETVNDHYDNAAVIFLDIVGFTAISDQLSSGQVVNLLDQIFTTLDAVCANHDVVKIKTIGDSYLAVAFPNESPNVEQRAAQAALEMIAALTQITTPTGAPLEARLGIHCGPLTAGVIGTTRLQYDVWGDTVNVASRMESTSEPGRIHISESLAKALGEAHIVPRGPLEIRGKGMMNTYWLESAD